MSLVLLVLGLAAIAYALGLWSPSIPRWTDVAAFAGRVKAVFTVPKGTLPWRAALLVAGVLLVLACAFVPGSGDGGRSYDGTAASVADAVRAFQSSHGLRPVDGLVGPVTYKALVKAAKAGN